MTSAVSFGYERRPRGRHIALAEYDPDPSVVAVQLVEAPTAEQSAELSFAALQSELGSVPCDENTDRIDKTYVNVSPTEIVVCGTCGRGRAHRGRCPKCGGYAMSLTEIAAYRNDIAKRNGGGDGR